jgi:hypothetical protein
VALHPPEPNPRPTAVPPKPQRPIESSPVAQPLAEVKQFLGKSSPIVVPPSLFDAPRPRDELSPHALLLGSRSPARETAPGPLEPHPPGSRSFIAREAAPGLLAPAANLLRPSSLVRVIQALVSLAPCRVHRPSIDFGVSLAAARHNRALLKEKENDLGRLITEQPFSVMTMGSEFRAMGKLKTLLSSHPLWDRWEEGLSNGVTYPMAPYDAGEMRLDLEAQLQRGNHKSAVERIAVLDGLNAVDTAHGYSFCLPSDAIRDIREAAVAPHGVIHQGTIDEFGAPASKDRPTHDQSFSARPGGRSINSRCLMDETTPCMFGHALLRMVHFVLHLRRLFPARRIFLQKVDFKAAYRRIHLSATMASKCVTVVRDLAFVSLRMPFGGKPCPSLFADFSETITDLSNAIATDPSWNPATLRSPLQHLIPRTVTEPDEAPFAQSLPTSVHLPADDNSYKADVYIDDILVAVLDDQKGCHKGSAAALLAIHSVGRPVAVDEPISRDQLTAEKKLIAESLLEETKITLGWLLDTRRLRISLPMEKYAAWAATILFILITESISYQVLESLVGRLNHVCFIIPSARHFMSRLRWLLQSSGSGRRIRLRPQILADLRLWLRFLELAHAGISLNLISFRHPTHIFRTDASEHGIGGFCAISGVGWRIELPPDCRVGMREGITLNLFEFLGGIIAIWVEILAGRVPPFSCLLAQGDSTSATGWLRKSNFVEHSHRLQLEASRHLAFLVLAAQTALYSQWFPGDENGTADVLSRDFHLSDHLLTAMLLSSLPTQVPPNFAICPLPPAVSCWLMSLLRSQPLTGASKKEPTRSSTWHGLAGHDGSSKLNCLTTSTWRLSSPSHGPDSSVPSPRQSAQLDFQEQLMTSLLPRPSPVPSTTWHRPSWTPEFPTPDKPSPGPLRDFYSASTGATETPTPTSSNKKP